MKKKEKRKKTIFPPNLSIVPFLELFAVPIKQNCEPLAFINCNKL